MKRSAFTLVELLVVIAIISILAALLFPTLANVVDSAHRTVCANNQRQIIMAEVQYADDFNDHIHYQLYSTGAHNQIRYWPSPAHVDAEFTYLAMIYLDIDFDLTFTNYRVGSPKDRSSVLYCPDMKTPDCAPNMFYYYKYSHMSYGIYGATYDRNNVSGEARIRYSKLGSPLNGMRKVLIGDIVQPGVQYQGSALPYYWLNHDFTGGNFGYSDGSVNWSCIGNMRNAPLIYHSYSANCYFPIETTIYCNVVRNAGKLWSCLQLWNPDTNSFQVSYYGRYLASEFY